MLIFLNFFNNNLKVLESKPIKLPKYVIINTFSNFTTHLNQITETISKTYNINFAKLCIMCIISKLIKVIKSYRSILVVTEKLEEVHINP